MPCRQKVKNILLLMCYDDWFTIAKVFGSISDEVVDVGSEIHGRTIWHMIVSNDSFFLEPLCVPCVDGLDEESDCASSCANELVAESQRCKINNCVCHCRAPFEHCPLNAGTSMFHVVVIACGSKCENPLSQCLTEDFGIMAPVLWVICEQVDGAITLCQVVGDEFLRYQIFCNPYVFQRWAHAYKPTPNKPPLPTPFLMH